MRQIGHRTIEPKMDAGDGRVLECADIDAQLRNHGLDAFEGQRADIVVGPHLPAAGDDARTVPLRSRSAITGERNRNSTLPMRFQRRFAIESAERHGGDAHFIGVLTRKKAQAENLEAMRGGHAIQFLVDRADQHLPPEALDGARRSGAFARASGAC